jgi:ankyrin repeat protein
VNTLDSTGKGPLEHALAKNRREIIDYLRSSGARMAGGIFEAAEKGDLAHITARIEEYPPVVNAKEGKTGDTPLLSAARGRKAAAMKLLISKNADVTSKDGRGTGALHLASKAGFDEIMLLLIEKGADIKEPDMEGNTPLHYAAMSGVVRAAKVLTDRKAALSALNRQKKTPYGLAVKLKLKDMAEFLRRLGAQ